ncbi:hypothetical protein CYLTODRAFT_488549 [Cylindrobasidium torrendii FP15055 ss-10]|uniref:FAD/NAD(P)-binding domain-containing protein n=1 Tax=Cylindrobasidium torrendii FP15055 ss-10 TaxID=1314674 RepID=A0A0D7BJM6_9AGAR|nr:hypothetical protein CYLTODRAFT_488549 [Cylindrobasidium torrendii FP15055 ss-10]
MPVLDILWLLSSATLLYYGFGVIWGVLRQRSIVKNAAWYDIPQLGRPRQDTERIPGTAVVCSGSMGGLLAARICSDHFERVVIIEPENWLSTEDAQREDSWNQDNKRTRVMQYKSFQTTQHFVYKIFEQVFPQRFLLEAKARDMIIAEGDWNGHYWGLQCKDIHPHFGGVIPTTSFPNIEQVLGTVTGVKTNESGAGLLQGVSYRDSNGEVHDLDAALVVDCTGPTQGGVKWLQRAGFATDLKKRTYNPRMRYCTFEFTPSREIYAQLPIPGNLEKGAPAAGGILVNWPDPSLDNRWVAMARMDGHRIHVCCGGWGEADLPSTVDGLVDFVHSLKVVRPLPGWLFDTLKLLHQCEDTLTTSVVHVPACFWSQYQLCDSVPNNCIALGDAVCRINPLYGQGIAKAFVGAITLNSLLDNARTQSRLPSTLSRDFFRMQAARITGMWESPKTKDYGFATTVPEEHETLETGSFMRKYMMEIFRLCTEDGYIHALLIRNALLMDASPMDLLHPKIFLRVLGRWALQSVS